MACGMGEGVPVGTAGEGLAVGLLPWVGAGPETVGVDVASRGGEVGAGVELAVPVAVGTRVGTVWAWAVPDQLAAGQRIAMPSSRAQAEIN